MRFINTFLIIALLSFSLTNSFEFASLVEVAEINASSFGKSLLETVSLSLEQKGNVGEVNALLGNLLFKLNSDQAKDTAAWNKENRRLQNKIARLTKEIEALRREILRLVAEKAKYEKLRDQAAKNLLQYKKQKHNNNVALKENAARRALDKADFLRSQNEHQDIINALHAVHKELNRLVGSVSGGGPAHVRQNLEEGRDAKLRRAFVQISKDEAEIQQFIQTATSADQNALRNLLNALTKIENSVRRSLADDEAHERRSANDFAHLQNILTRDNKQLTSMIKQETANHKLYVKRVAELVVRLAQTRALRKSKKAERVATIAERLAKEQRYNADKAQRDEERRVMNRIDEIVKRRLENMSKMLNDQI